MIRDLLRDTPQPTPAGLTTSDVCIVGAGAAGIVLAVELIRQGRTVTLLEGGGADIEDDSQEPFASEVTGRPHRGIHEGRFRAKGGTTTRWGGQILEFQPIDFAARAWVPASGWPFDHAELESFYERALKLEGLDPVLRADAAVWAAVDEAQPVFEGLDPYFSRWCPEPNFARVHGALLASESGPQVWLHANVVELEMDGERAAGVRCRTLTGREAIFRAERYVFCLGAIESSRFFLQPRAGSLPWNRSGLLGRHFQDHVDANVAAVVPRDLRRFHALFDNVFLRGLKYHPKLRLSAHEQTRRRTLNIAATMHFESPADQALAANKATAKHLLRGRLGELKASDLASLLGNLPTLARQSYRYAFEHRAYNPADAAMRLFVYCEQSPDGASSITLAETRDRLGMLRTRLDWRVADAEVATIRNYVEVARAALAHVAEIVPEPTLGQPEFRARCGDSNHHMGGMRMAASETAGVVDTDLRLHGTRNVYIGSAAVFPTSGNSNPTHTLLALMVRLADHLG